MIAVAAIALLSLACAGTGTLPASAQSTDSQVRQLASDLETLAAGPQESALLARAAVEQSRLLAREYRMTRPALLHNVLVNVGLKERGLCWHWTEDMLERLGRLPLDAYDLHWGTAHRGELLREHNSVIVTAKGGAFETGIVLDPWRNSGALYWAPVGEDSYPWEPH